MLRHLAVIFIFLICLSPDNALAQSSDSVYVFSYFKGRGDGLHLAYSEDGYSWSKMFGDSILLKPSLSKDSLMRDPCIIRGDDGIYHLVWTVSWNDPGIGYASSPDLIHWSSQQYIPVMGHEKDVRNAWAPEVTYDPVNKEFMIYWASTITGRFSIKDTAAESGYNHRMYYTITKDFKKFSPTRLLYDPGFSVIDATILNNGTNYVMFLKNETRYPAEKNIRVAYSSQLTGPYSQAGPAITGNYWAEGPTVLKMKNKWIVYFDKYRDHRYGAIESLDLITWKDVSDKIILPDGIRHGSILVVNRKEFLRK